MHSITRCVYCRSAFVAVAFIGGFIFTGCRQKTDVVQLSLIQQEQSMAIDEWEKFVGTGIESKKTILQPLESNTPKNQLRLHALKDLVVWYCNGTLFIAFEKGGKIYESPQVFVYPLPKDATLEDNYKIEDEISDFEELKKILKERKHEHMLGVNVQ